VFLVAQTNVNIRMDENLKKQFDAFCSEIGMNMTTAFCVFAKTAVRQNRIPFEISAESDPFYSEANQARLRKSIADLNAGKGKVHELTEVADE
jgi:DNA-damage-inducible protein J